MSAGEGPDHPNIFNVLSPCVINITLPCLPLYSTSTRGLSKPPAMLIGFNNPFNLLCLAAIWRSFSINPVLLNEYDS
jgi:hypothetical protein